jgi:ribonuclease R
LDAESLKKLILDTLKAGRKKHFRRRELYNQLGKKHLDYIEYAAVLTELVESGAVSRVKGRQYSLPEKTGIVTGAFSPLRNGGGFIRTPDGESVFVRFSDVEGALPGDRVQAKILKKKRAGLSATARIVAILERSTRPVVGVFHRRGPTAWIAPREDGFIANLLVKNALDTDAVDGDLVVARIEHEAPGLSRPLCTVTEVLGKPDAPGVDVLAIIRRYDLPVHFPDEAVAESERAPGGIDQAEIAKRTDLRGQVTFTIDPVDA